VNALSKSCAPIPTPLLRLALALVLQPRLTFEALPIFVPSSFVRLNLLPPPMKVLSSRLRSISARENRERSIFI
jgi:hypothetical protein